MPSPDLAKAQWDPGIKRCMEYFVQVYTAAKLILLVIIFSSCVQTNSQFWYDKQKRVRTHSIKNTMLLQHELCTIHVGLADISNTSTYSLKYHFLSL